MIFKRRKKYPDYEEPILVPITRQQLDDMELVVQNMVDKLNKAVTDFDRQVRRSIASMDQARDRIARQDRR